MVKRKEIRKVVSVSQNKCTCNFGYLLLAMLFLALGAFLLVNGFVTQYKMGVSNLLVLVWYFFGFLALTFGCYTKHRHLGCCPVHGWHK